MDVPEYDDSILITYETGKGSHHLLPVIFPAETVKALMYLTNKEIRKNAGVSVSNKYMTGRTSIGLYLNAINQKN